MDPLWMKYLPLQPYQYAGNDPVNMLDDNGKEIVKAKGQTQQQYELAMKMYNAAIDHFECKGVPWAASLLRAFRDEPSERFYLELGLTSNTRQSQLPIDVDNDGKIDSPISYNPKNAELYLNFTVGLRVENGYMSAFDVLMHEVFHAWLDQTDYVRTKRLTEFDDDTWTNIHEKEVITIFETALLRALKQLRDDDKPSRSSHDGTIVPVCGPSVAPSPNNAP